MLVISGITHFNRGEAEVNEGTTYMLKSMLGWRCYARNYAELRGRWREEAVLF